MSAAVRPASRTLGGLIDENGAQLIKDKVKVLGPNDDVKLFMPDGFTTQTTIDESAFAEARTVGDLARLAGDTAADEAGGAVRSTTSPEGLAAPKRSDREGGSRDSNSLPLE